MCGDTIANYECNKLLLTINIYIYMRVRTYGGLSLPDVYKKLMLPHKLV